MQWFQKLEEEALEDILAPINSIIERLKNHVQHKNRVIDIKKREIAEATAAIEKHHDERNRAVTALSNVSALLGVKNKKAA